jgi:hypothetical protein
MKKMEVSPRKNLVGFRKKGVKNEGNPRYVIENTYRKNVRFQPFHDIDENKTLTVTFP